VLIDWLSIGKFMSQIFINGKNKYLGSFNTSKEANNAYEFEFMKLKNK
jgi:hypothetical protein